MFTMVVSSGFTLVLPLPEDCQMLLRLGSWMMQFFYPCYQDWFLKQ